MWYNEEMVNGVVHMLLFADLKIAKMSVGYALHHVNWWR